MSAPVRLSRKNSTIKKLRNEGIRHETDENVSKIIELEDAIFIDNLLLKRGLSNHQKSGIEVERSGYMSELQKIYDRLKKETDMSISRGRWSLRTNNDNSSYITGTAVRSKGGARRTRKHRGRKMRKTRHTRR
jgi:hypothetical protein